MFSFLAYLALAIVFSFVANMLAPQQNTASKTEPGEISAPEASEGSPIPHVRGTRYVSVNCLWWQPEGTKEIKK